MWMWLENGEEEGLKQRAFSGRSVPFSPEEGEKACFRGRKRDFTAKIFHLYRIEL